MKKTLYSGAAILALAAGSAQAQELIFPVGEGDFAWDSYNAFADEYDLSGQTLTISGPWIGDDRDLVDTVFAYFEEATGATVEYAGSDAFESEIRRASQTGGLPNMAVIPQPGLLADLAAAGDVAPLTDEDAAWIEENYAAGQSWVDLATSENEQAGGEALNGFFYKVDVKSLVWYSPPVFEELGYEVPETMEELLALSEQAVEDGFAPWCIGLGSGDATGWPATDWVEDIMLRTQSLDTYDAWVSNELPFDSEEVVNAIETFGEFALNEDFTGMSGAEIVNTDFRDSPDGVFEIPPQCLMHRQASFIPTFFPEDAEYDFFYFPAFESEDLGSPVLGAGTVWAITDENEASRAMIEFLKTPVAHEVWMSQSGFLTPHNGVNTELYANDTLRGMGEILLNATSFRFDASDLMPSEIGAGAFWTGMVEYLRTGDAQAEAASIQSAWDAIK
ncbi:ABC transporter substrate-binding protein [Pelagovum pacificum]|uniref:Carbohydrate ABC transporter substrate-binding protein n=1 Tax=Pelagovum pacificum TaxID=2588711 RepID=A0A5C5GEL3_9RHOB|nr:ABC transporter substrate-binding protein [Pelagovum pacificum]QQA44849.1 carbohydrate ABC transporter substrate-binding protein [Pelagovum pacificum]TNY32046.1 carbohydrate ABC transporter substrate-binding protein [Pelagovum pacificum]